MGRKKSGLVLAMIAMMLIMVSVSGIEDELIQLPSELEQNEGAERLLDGVSRKMFKGLGSSMGKCPSGFCTRDSFCGRSCQCRIVSTSPFVYSTCVPK
ncbi:hypothetical protein SDJN03_24905, partial [Cucurbita argyrosperma subsp. sororia]